MTEPIRVLELRSVRGTGGGPEKTILLGSARTDASRFKVTVCYLRDRRDEVFGIDAKAAALGVDYIELLERHSFDLTLWPRLRRLVRDRRIDIVHAHEYKTDLLALLLARFEHVIPLSTVHGWTGHSWRERWLYYPLDKRLLAKYPRVVAVSEDVRQELVRHGASGDRVTTVLNGIDHLAFRRERHREPSVRRELGLAPEDMVIGAVGRLEPQKRFDVLIEALARLHAIEPALKLLIVGDGSLRNRLSTQISALGLNDACRLLGHRTDIVDVHHAFDLFVQASDYEGTPNAVLEAMALETPVIATDVGGTAELVRHGIDGVIVPAGDVTALSRAIWNVLANAECARARTIAARHRVETELSFDARMRSVEAIYAALVPNRSVPRSQSVCDSAFETAAR